MGRIAGFPGDSKRKRGDTAEKSGDLPEKLNRVRSLSLFGGGIQRKPRVIRGAHKGVVDEIPSAYKDIDEVMANQRDLTEILHTLKQVVCVKG